MLITAESIKLWLATLAKYDYCVFLGENLYENLDVPDYFLVSTVTAPCLKELATGWLVN